jgi:dienelactone hydrolase
MLKSGIMLLAFCVSLLIASAQQPDSITYAIKGKDTLWMHHYKAAGPANGISLLFVHGGSFTGGEPKNQRPMANGLSKMGYNVFVIKYRLALKGKDFGCGTATPEKLNAIQTAVDDALDATLHVVKNATALGVDTSKFFIAGSSAGAETVLNLVFNPFINKKDPRFDFFNRFRFTGLLSFSGALLDLNSIKNEKWIPLFLMHGTKDQLVPFGTAAHRFCRATDPGWMMFFGSHSIYEYAVANKKPLVLYTFPGAGHEVSNFMFRRFAEMDKFMRAAVQKKKLKAREVIIQLPAKS